MLGLGGRCSPYPAWFGFASVFFVGFARFYVQTLRSTCSGRGNGDSLANGRERPPSGHVEGTNKVSIFPSKKEAHRTPQFGGVGVDDRQKRVRIAESRKPA